jgi:hypothetical protein
MAWIQLWQAWPGREPMAHPEYARLFARPCDRVVCAAGEDEGGCVLFPLILRPLAAEPWASAYESRCDAITPYGYGGPFAWGRGPRNDAAFWRAYDDWRVKERIVSTFARLSLFPGQLTEPPGPIKTHAPNIVVPLAEGADELWRRCDKNVRTCVRAAERAGLVIEIDPTGIRLDSFLNVYTQTMQRRGASDWYFFSRNFFSDLIAKLPGQFVFFHALLNGKVVSSDLILSSPDHIYYFLAGTLAEAYSLKPTYLLKHSEIRWGIGQSKKSFVLGGGYESGDGIFRFKRAFAPHGEVPFRTACMIGDDRSYRELERDRQAFASHRNEVWTPRPDFFPVYRS